MSSETTPHSRRTQFDLRAWIGRQIQEQRREARVTQAQLARCARVDQGYLSRIEAGKSTPSVDSLARLARCLGCEVGIRLFPTAGPRLHDRFQAPMVEALVNAAGPAWRPRLEVPVPAARGIIDVALSRSLDRLTVACECHSEVRRLEQVLRRANEKADALRADTGGAGSVSSLLALRSTRATREIAVAFHSTLATAYPARLADALEALRGNAAWPGPALIWMQVVAGRARILERVPRRVRVGR